MTETTTYNPATDPVRQFAAALTPATRAHLHHTQRLTVLIHRAIREQGWTVEQLVTRCTNNLGNNPGGIITFRLEHCAEHPPITPTGRQRLPFCTPECKDNAGWILDNDGRPVNRCQCRTPVGA